MLRKTSIVLNAVIVALSLLLFVYTFVARTHAEEHVRDFVTEKTLLYSKSLVGLMRSGINSSMAQKFVSKELSFELKEELLAYDSNPAEYITSLTAKRMPKFEKGKVQIFKDKLHEHYQSTLSALVRDLRIFSASNLIAGGMAMWLLLTAKTKQKGKVVAFSFVIFATVAFSTFSYLDGVSFLRIMLKSHLGWWYPAGMIMMIVALVLEHGLHKNENVDAKAR